MKKVNASLIAFCCLLAAGCGRTTPPVEPMVKHEEVTADREPIRRAVSNIESYLRQLEGRLTISNADTWNHEASAALRDLGNIRIELRTLRKEHSAGNFEASLSDLESKLRGARPENWSANAPAAQYIVGNIRFELQRFSRAL